MLVNNQFIYKGQPSFLAKLFLSHYLLDWAYEPKAADADRSISPTLVCAERRAWIRRQLDLRPGSLIPVSAVCSICKHFRVSWQLRWRAPKLPLGEMDISTPDSPKELGSSPSETAVIVDSADCIPGTHLSVSHVILTMALGRRCCYYPHFIRTLQVKKLTYKEMKELAQDHVVIR